MHAPTHDTTLYHRQFTELAPSLYAHLPSAGEEPFTPSDIFTQVPGWHFLPNDGRLAHIESTHVVQQHATYAHAGSLPTLCEHGLHAARTITQAACSYAPGCRLTRVVLWGDIQENTHNYDGKLVGRYRRVDNIYNLWNSLGSPLGTAATSVMIKFLESTHFLHSDAIHAMRTPAFLAQYQRAAEWSAIYLCVRAEHGDAHNALSAYVRDLSHTREEYAHVHSAPAYFSKNMIEIMINSLALTYQPALTDHGNGITVLNTPQTMLRQALGGINWALKSYAAHSDDPAPVLNNRYMQYKQHAEDIIQEAVASGAYTVA